MIRLEKFEESRFKLKNYKLWTVADRSLQYSHASLFLLVPPAAGSIRGANPDRDCCMSHSTPKLCGRELIGAYLKTKKILPSVLHSDWDIYAAYPCFET